MSKDFIEELSRTDPIIHGHMRLYSLGRCTYTEALEQMVVCLHSVNKDQQDSLVKMMSVRVFMPFNN